jgi:hypothetical protein
MPEPQITLFPKDAETPADIKGFIRDGEFFHIGDQVMLIHRPSGSKLFGTLGGIYGVGRIRGFKVLGVPFVREALYPMGKPSDANYGLALMERSEAALALAKVHYERETAEDETAVAWEAYPEFAQENYLAALAVGGKL